MLLLLHCLEGNTPLGFADSSRVMASRGSQRDTIGWVQRRFPQLTLKHTATCYFESSLTEMCFSFLSLVSLAALTTSWFIGITPPSTLFSAWIRRRVNLAFWTSFRLNSYSVVKEKPKRAAVSPLSYSKSLSPLHPTTFNTYCRCEGIGELT